MIAITRKIWKRYSIVFMALCSILALWLSYQSWYEYRTSKSTASIAIIHQQDSTRSANVYSSYHLLHSLEQAWLRQNPSVKIKKNIAIKNMTVQYTLSTADSQLDVNSLLENFIQVLQNKLVELQRSIEKSKLRTYNEKLNEDLNQLLTSQIALTEFESQHPQVYNKGIPSPQTKTIDKFKAEITKLQAQLQTKLTYMSPTAPEINRLKSRITALEQQLPTLTDDFLTDQSLQQRWMTLKTKQQFAEDRYQISLKQVTKKSLQTNALDVHIAVIDPPHIPPSFFRKYFHFLIIITLLAWVSITAYLLTRHILYKKSQISTKILNQY
ncbi:MAG: hypothetical protein ACOH5I_13075 [Oligoflexus sp.]